MLAAVTTTCTLIAAPAQAASRLSWLAAGDSYSSGEGLPHATGPCAQAKPGSGSLAWADVANNQLGGGKSRFSAPDLTACTGAASPRFFNADGRKPAEWSPRMGRFDLVTFTFGGDDVDFAHVIRQCIHDKRPGSVKYLSDPGHHCPMDSLLRSMVREFGRVFQRRLVVIANTALAPGGNILVLGYPELIEAPSLWSAAKRKAGGCGHLTIADAYELRGLAGDLNATIAQDVTTVNGQRPNSVHLTFVDVNSGGSAGISRDDRNLFEPAHGARHNLCSKDPWINPVTGIDSGRGSYHPKQAGQNAMGALAADVIRGMRWPTPAGVVLRDCRAFEKIPTVIEPARILCGAVNAPEFTALIWRGWGNATADATGKVTYRTCPGLPGTGCADPRNYHTVPVQLTVGSIENCDGQRAYTLLVAHFREVDGTANGYHLSLTLGWRSCVPPGTCPGSFVVLPGVGDATISDVRVGGVSCPLARAAITSYEGSAHTRPFTINGEAFQCPRRAVGPPGSGAFDVTCESDSGRTVGWHVVFQI